ncbi:putative NinC-like recombination protein [Microcystis phage Mae-JY30]
MSSPFIIDGRVAISFSGGRTSGMMLKLFLEAHGGTLPTDYQVVFANTGKEREETLRFVHECGVRWGVDIAWVEWRLEGGFERVGLNSASRNGEPFEALIEWKQYLPNWQARWCTGFLKVEAMGAYLASLGWKPGDYREAIGLRHDEGLRLLKMYERNEKHVRQCVAPLSKAKLVKADVTAFWKEQPFDLALKPGEGNCDLCFLKGRGLRKQLIRARPGSVEWWKAMEAKRGLWFDRRDTYAGLEAEVRNSPDLFEELDQSEDDVECGLLCGPAGDP